MKKLKNYLLCGFIAGVLALASCTDDNPDLDPENDENGSHWRTKRGLGEILPWFEKLHPSPWALDRMSYSRLLGAARSRTMDKGEL